MKLKTILALSASVYVGVFQTQAAIITQWTFETSPPADLANSSASWNIGADSGIGTASGLHASANADWSTPAGVNSANSMSVNEWASGDYFQFASGSIGYNNIKLTLEAASSSTGPKDFKLAWSLTGSSFTDFISYAVAVNGTPNSTWNGSLSPAQAVPYLLSFDLSGVSALNNAATVYFRLINTSAASEGGNGGVVLNTGTSRVDDFTISGDLIATAVPEPSTYIAGLLLALPFGVHGVRYLRNRKRA